MLGVSETSVLDAVGKLGDLGDRLGDKTYALCLLTHGLMIRLAEQPVGCVYSTYSALRYDLMGIIPWRDSPVTGPLLYASGWPLMPSTSRNLPICLTYLLYALCFLVSCLLYAS